MDATKTELEEQKARMDVMETEIAQAASDKSLEPRNPYNHLKRILVSDDEKRKRQKVNHKKKTLENLDQKTSTDCWSMLSSLVESIKNAFQYVCEIEDGTDLCPISWMKIRTRTF